jgi:hypothetical protein
MQRMSHYLEMQMSSTTFFHLAARITAAAAALAPLLASAHIAI